MEKIIVKLDELQNKLEELKKLDYLHGKDELYSISEIIERIIYRVYPEKDALILKKKLGIYSFSLYGQEQTNYIKMIDKTIIVINTIKEENELFGFDDFKPLKEKIETEWQVGSNKLGYIKKKKTK